jgi:hypothetical protein
MPLDKVSKKMLDFNPATKEETGDITTLTTTDKTSLVKAVNETVSQLAEKATDINERGVNVKTLGAKNNDNVVNGVTNSTVINNALVDNPTVYIPAGTFNISSPITIPANKKLIIDENTIIKPTSDIDVFILNNKSVLIGGNVQVGSVLNYSKSVLTIPTGALTNIKVKGLRAFNNYDTPSGKAVNLDCTAGVTKYIAFSFFEDFHFEGFQYGLYLNNTAPMNFANAITFIGVINSCTTAVYNNADGNYINIVGEVGKAPNNEPAIHLKGSQNIVDAVIFDLGRSNGVGWNNIGLINDGLTNKVRVNFGQSKIIDNSGGRNLYSHSFTQLPNARSSARYEERGSVYAGDQSNFLVSADKRFTVTQTLTNVQNWSSLSEAFKVNESIDLVYHFNDPTSLSDNAQVTIDFGSPTAISLVGVNLKLAKYCKKMVYEYYTTNGNKWVSKEIKLTNAGSYMWDIATEPNVHYDTYGYITKLRFTFYEPVSTDIYIHQIFAASDRGGYSFLPSHGGSLYGDVDLTDSYLKVGKKTALPTATATHRGRIIRIEGATNVADAIYTCKKLSNDTYEWVQIG